MIVVHEVRKRFGPVTALDAVSLRVEPGERVAIVGTNGSGKTTLLRALVGLVRVEGKVEIAGVDVARDPARALAHVAYAPQIAPPIDAPVREVVRVQCALRGRPASAVAERAARLGLDLARVEGTRFRDLSGGMKQKVLAALALAAEAPILVCDEPTANLDAHARAAFFAQIDARPKDAILVLCSHRVDEVRNLVDRVIELRDGRVARDAPLAQLLSGLRSFRVEVSTRRDEAGPLAAWLSSRGFVASAPGRWAGAFTQDEKLEVVSALLAAHGAEVLDLSVFDDGEVTAFTDDVPSGSRPSSRKVA